MFIWLLIAMRKQLDENDKGLVKKLSEHRGTIALITGFAVELHMAYQYVYINQCRHTAFTGIEKFAGVGFLVYGIYNAMNKNFKKY